MSIEPFPRISVREYLWPPAVCDGMALGFNEIHVWSQQLTRTQREIASFRRLLSADELERATRFRFENSRSDYIISRGTLRHLLGLYLSANAEDLRFEYSAYGRPGLHADTHGRTLDFNVSHSGGIVLLGFSRGRRVGVDVEKIRRDFETSEIAERFFSTAERDSLRLLPVEQRHEAFFRCWTSKEAFIKALGGGLSHPLDQFDVSLTPESPPVLLATRPNAQEVLRWKLCNIHVPRDYSAALAFEAESSISPY
jgi:4'-phosphopantetheinyl transferase